MKNDRVPTNYIVTREQKRYIAKQNMKKAGKTHICKHDYNTIKRGSFVSYTREPSYFSKHWREFVEV